jgi:hypothetical protein
MKQLLVFIIILAQNYAYCQDSSWYTVRNAPGLKKGEFYKIRGKDTVTIIDPEADNPDAVWIGEHQYVTQAATDSKKTNTIMRYVDQMPKAEYDIEAYLANQTQCPASQFNNKNSKRVNVQFVVTANGSITNVKVVTHLQPDLDSIAKHTISNMPKWKPAMLNGKTVDVYYTLPVYFDSTKPAR